MGYIAVAGRDWESRSLRAEDDECEVGRLRARSVSREGEAAAMEGEGRLKKGVAKRPK